MKFTLSFRSVLIGIGSCLLLLSSPMVFPDTQPVVITTLQKTGPNEYELTFRASVHAAPKTVWNVLTDYDHHARYLPNLTRSVVLERSPGSVVVQQEGKIRVLFWTFRIQVTQRIHEHAGQGFDFEAIGGDFKQMRGSWVLRPNGSETRLDSQFRMIHKYPVPAWAVQFVSRRYLLPMIRALIQKAENEPIALPGTTTP